MTAPETPVPGDAGAEVICEGSPVLYVGSPWTQNPPPYQTPASRAASAEALRVLAGLAGLAGGGSFPASLGPRVLRAARRQKTTSELGVLAVACPQCGAQPGHDCDRRTLGSWRHHRARRDAIDRHRAERSASVSDAPESETLAER